MSCIPAVVLGSTGYVGGELLRLLRGHPHFRLAAAVSESHGGKTVAEVFPHLAAGFPGATFAPPGAWATRLAPETDLALFSAAPHGASATLVARALEETSRLGLRVRVVDSSADFRYREAADYERVYGSAHGAPGLLADFQCALPEHAAGIPPKHVGHPGCFATAVLLAAVPLVNAGIVDTPLYVTGVTGSTGAGRSAQSGTHHPERHSNYYAYKPLTHRHVPEVESLIAAACGRTAAVRFVPHSGPFARGIHATLQAGLATTRSLDDIRAAFHDYYREAQFVRIVDHAPRLKDVVASNYCHIGIAMHEDTVVVMSIIDNLVKGAAGGAVQWMNRLWSLPETCGLESAAPAWT